MRGQGARNEQLCSKSATQTWISWTLDGLHVSRILDSRCHCLDASGLMCITSLIPQWFWYSAMGAAVGSALLIPDSKPPDPVIRTSDLIPDIGSRRERRQSEARAKKRFQSGDNGIHAHGLRKQYPRRLRSERTYLTTPKTHHERRNEPTWFKSMHRDFKGRADCDKNWRGHRHKLHSTRFRTPTLKDWDAVRRHRLRLKTASSDSI